jgi:hypothetical protein
VCASHLQLLGIKPDADNNEINRAFNKKKWENKADPVMRNRIENAHSQLMMAAFNARIRVRTAQHNAIALVTV